MFYRKTIWFWGFHNDLITLNTPQCTVNNGYCTLHTKDSILNTLHSTLHIKHSKHNIQYSKLDTQHSTLYNHTLHITRFTLKHETLNTAQQKNEHSTPTTEHWIPCNAHRTPHSKKHTVHFTLHTKLCQLYTTPCVQKTKDFKLLTTHSQLQIYYPPSPLLDSRFSVLLSWSRPPWASVHLHVWKLWSFSKCHFPIDWFPGPTGDVGGSAQGWLNGRPGDSGSLELN